MKWTRHKTTTPIGPKRPWYSAEVHVTLRDGGSRIVRATITPRRPQVTRAWGKGRKISKSQVVYDVRIGNVHQESNFGTVALAKEFVAEYIAAPGPAERAAVVRGWR